MKEAWRQHAILAIMYNEQKSYAQAVAEVGTQGSGGSRGQPRRTEGRRCVLFLLHFVDSFDAAVSYIM
jgi:hypothetical protein